MLLNLLARFDFLDFIVLAVFLRICYISFKTGLSIEIFKLLGALFATYFSLHYYTMISDLIRRRFLPKEMPLEFMDFIIFLLLAILVYFGFIVLRTVLSRFIQLNAIPRLNQAAGLILGIGRGFLVVGLLSYSLAVSSVDYFKGSVKHSYLGSRAVSISPRTYGWLWNNVFSKFSGREKFNSTVNEVMDKFSVK
ncbi:MAG: CvpA family protein [Candidatus Omnitrophota bacterium]|jgi:uncharacterized membrane protein required for colicin V production